MGTFTAVIKSADAGKLYFDVPSRVMERLELKPFMAGKMVADKGGIRIFGFEKTVKIKLDLPKKTIALLKKIMKTEGYGSIDETVCNVIDKVFAKKSKKESNTAIVYLYPSGFLESGFVLIDDYEKKFKAKTKVKGPKNP